MQLEDTEEEHLSAEEENYYRGYKRWYERQSRFFIIAVIAVLLVVLIGGSVLFVRGWPNRLDGAADMPAATMGVRVNTQVVSSVPTDQSMVDGRGIYLLSYDQPTGPFTLKKVDLRTKSVVWSQKLAELPTKVTMIRGVVYVTSQPLVPNPQGIETMGVITAFDAHTGKLFWRANLGSDMRAGAHVSLSQLSPPIVLNDTLLLTATDGAIIALDARTGAKRWMDDTGTTTLDVLSSAGSVIYWTYPLASDGGIVYGSIHNKVFAVDVSTGKELWSQTVGSDQMLISPQIMQGVAYIASFGMQRAKESTQNTHGGIYAFDAHTGKSLWERPAPITSFSPPLVVTPRLIYFGAADGSIHALDIYNGRREVWQAKGESALFLYILQGSDGTVYASGRGLMALDPENGLVLWQKAMGSNSTKLEAAGFGVVYVSALSGQGSATLYALNNHDGSERWHWALTNRYSQIMAVVP